MQAVHVVQPDPGAFLDQRLVTVRAPAVVPLLARDVGGEDDVLGVRAQVGLAYKRAVLKQVRQSGGAHREVFEVAHLLQVTTNSRCRCRSFAGFL